MVNSKTTSSLFLHTFILIFICLLFSWPSKTDAALSITNPVASTVWDKNISQTVTISRNNSTPTGNIRVCMAPAAGGTYTYISTISITVNGSHTVSVPSSLLSTLATGEYRVYATTNASDCSVTTGRVQSAIFNLGPYISINTPSAAWSLGTYGSQTITVDRYLVDSNIKIFIQPYSAPTGQLCREIGLITGGSATPVNQTVSNISLSGVQTGAYKLIATTGSDCGTSSFRVESGQFSVNAPSFSVTATPSLWWDKLDALDQTVSVTKTNYTGAFKICLRSEQGIFTDLVSVASSTTVTIPRTITDATLQSVTSTDPTELQKFKVFVTTSSDCSSSVALFKTEIPSPVDDFITVFSSFVLNTPSVVWNKLDNNRTPQIVEVVRNGTDISTPLKVCLQTSAGVLISSSTFSTTIPAGSSSVSVDDTLLNSVNAGTYNLIVTTHTSDCSNVSGFTRKVSGNFSITAQAVPTITTASTWDESDGVVQNVTVQRSGITSALKVCAVLSIEVPTLIEENGELVEGTVIEDDTYLLGTIASGSNSVNISDAIISGFVPPANGYKIRVTSGVDCDDLSNGVVIGESSSINIISTIEVSPVPAPSGGWNKIDNQPQSFNVKSNGYNGSVAVCAKQGATYYPLGVVTVTSGNSVSLDVSDPINTNQGVSIPGSGILPGTPSTLVAVTTSIWTTGGLTAANCATAANQSSTPKIYRAQSEPFYILSVSRSLESITQPSSIWNVADGIDQSIEISRNYVTGPLSVCIKARDWVYISTSAAGFIPASQELIHEVVITDAQLLSIVQSFANVRGPGLGYSLEDYYTVQVRLSPEGSTSANCATGGVNEEKNVYVTSQSVEISIDPSSEWNRADGINQNVEILKSNISSSVLVCMVSSNYEVVYKTTRYDNQPAAFYISDSDLLNIDNGSYKMVVTDNPSSQFNEACVNRDQSYAWAETPYFDLVSKVPFSITTDYEWNKGDILPQRINITKNDGFAGFVRLCIKTPSSTYYDLSYYYGYPNNYLDVYDSFISSFQLGTNYKIIAMSSVFPCNTNAETVEAPFSIVSQTSSLNMGIHPKVWSSPAVMPQIFSIIRENFGSSVKICLKTSSGNYSNSNSYSIGNNNFSYSVNSGQPVTGFLSGVTDYIVKATASTDCVDTAGTQSAPISFRITGPVDMTGNRKGGMNGVVPDDIFGHAFSSNTGWIKFSSSEEPSSSPLYGVDIDESGYLSGYAWSENSGWLSFNNSDGSHPRAKVDTDGTVSGWAKFVSADNQGWDGWVSFRGVADNGTSYGVSYDKSTGYFSGWAWGSDVIGSISFNSETDQNRCGTNGSCEYAVEGPKIIDAPTNLSLESYCTGPNSNRVPAIRVNGTSTSNEHRVSYTMVTGTTCPSTASSYTNAGDTTAGFPYSLPQSINIQESAKYCLMISPTSGYYSSPSGYDSSILASSNPVTAEVCPDVIGNVRIDSLTANPERINRGESCDLGWNLEDLGPNSICKLEFQNPVDGSYVELRTYTYPEMSEIGAYSASNITRETKFKLSCWESDNPTRVDERTSTCFINASFKEVQ